MWNESKTNHNINSIGFSSRILDKFTGLSVTEAHLTWNPHAIFSLYGMNFWSIFLFHISQKQKWENYNGRPFLKALLFITCPTLGSKSSFLFNFTLGRNGSKTKWRAVSNQMLKQQQKKLTLKKDRKSN